ncbi:hypothetical protein OEZ86_004787 [Tetradesmus obliquus]|nr:hypothetical protein OEZ86_004787 [Tetradesmus obliquus]
MAAAGNWKSKLAVASVVGLICAGIYPVVVVPLQIAYGGAERPARDPGLPSAGFKKGGMWGHIDSASKQAKPEDQQQES